jgi:glycine cleavage system H protein
MSSEKIENYEVRTDLAYDPATHMWLETQTDGSLKVGMDPLGVETSGTLAQLAMVAPGSSLTRGEPFGTMEAEKFVGPLVAPVSGTVVEINPAVLAEPHLAEGDCYGEGWLMTVAPSRLTEESGEFVTGAEIPAWFAAEIEHYRQRGMLAE